MTSASAVVWGGFGVGILFGMAGRLSGFCLLSGLRGMRPGGDGRHMRTFALALAVALVGSQALQSIGLVDLSQSLYVRPSFSPLLAFAGGALFGIGMVLANGCGARALVLLGGGNLRSLIVLICIAIGGYLTLSGLLAPLRVLGGQTLVVNADVGTLPGVLSKLGLNATVTTWLVVGATIAGLVVFVFSHAPFRQSHRMQIGGVLIGCAIVAGWYVTGALGADEFDPAPTASASFIAPVGDSLLYLMLASGMKISFGVTLVAGVALGAFVVAIAQGALQLQGFATPQAMLRAMTGGVLMGIGGALAAGCSIGQGLSGLSTLALMSFPAAAGILTGAILALRALSAPADSTTANLPVTEESK